nr:hypothetical protein [Alkalicoccus urumqiensis]
MKQFLLLISAAAALVLTGCSGNTTEENSAGSADDIKQLVEAFSLQTAEAETASISSETLTVQDSSGTTEHELPEDEFFVSIAPFVNETHP